MGDIMKILREYKFFFAFVIIILGFFIYRTILTMGPLDEAYNILQAYRTTQGQLPFVTNWEIASSSAVFMLPFFWLYKFIAGGLEGIILFYRIFYLLINIIIGITVYRLLKNKVENIIIIATMTFLVTYAPFSAYFWWYDTALLLFMFVGLIFLLNYIYSTNNKSKTISLMLAGVIHAFMVFSYPTSLLTYISIVVIFIIINRKKIFDIKWYLLGTLIVFLLFILYCLIVGFENISLFNSEIYALDTESHNMTFSVGYLFNRAGRMLSKTFNYTLYKWIITIGLLIIWSIGKVLDKKLIKISFIFLLILSAFIIGFNRVSFALVDFSFYLFLWTPFLYFYVPKEKKGISKKIFILFWVTSLINYYVIGITSYSGVEKSRIGVYSGVFCGLIFIFFILKKVHKRIFLLAAMILILSQLVLYYTNYFDGWSNYSENTYIMKSGVYKGLKVGEQYREFEEQEKFVYSSRDEDDKYIFCIDLTMSYYLFSDLQAATNYSWQAYKNKGEKDSDWEATFYYFEHVSGNPDMIVLYTDRFVEKAEIIKEFIEEKYEFYGEREGTSIYKKIED